MCVQYQPDELKMPVALQQMHPCKKLCKESCHGHKLHITHQCLNSTLNFSSLPSSCMLELSMVTRFSTNIPEKLEHKTSFEILSFNTYRVPYFKEVIQPVSWMWNSCKSEVFQFVPHKSTGATLSEGKPIINTQLSLNAPLYMCVSAYVCWRACVLCLCNRISVMS